ncbi:phage replisome organizer N-terminal domain-containing protein [Clostridium frigidicarnis]|uniref:Phage replisome organizer, putative, N-terminal region n=1 Tax=Clostridium frigidicarnis TaxID=84698 RepID=A0A1I0V3M3_9CLOT|nr:phage replisome organizer N-terminal domain-containing protein [Clostridium frigidicarnis]SFA70713.1 phage replisome organizer, putative, N-terminal region [Clostridium frigidicarnis]
MADNKKYYYLKIKDNFYDTEDIKLLQSMENGYMYSDILMKLYLKSLKNNGKLVFKDHIPYNPKMIATITGHNSVIVEKALSIFKDLGLIEILDNGAIYMLDIQNFIGKSSSEGDRKREYRKKIEAEKNNTLLIGQVSGQMSDEHPPEIEIEIELEKEIDIKIEKEGAISKDIVSNNKLQPIIDKWNSLNLNKLVSINYGTNRYTMLNARIKEYGLENILLAIENVKTRPFLKGQNDRGWVITFDWFVKPNNFIKVLEGNYNNNNKEVSNGSTRENIKQGEGKYTGFKVPKPKLTGKSECDDLI